MTLRKLVKTLVAIAVLGGMVAGAILTKDLWYDRLFPPKAEQKDPHAGHAHGNPDRIKLSPQAIKTMRLDVKPIQIRPEYWRTIQVPGKIVERPGRSDQGISSPLPGVVKEIFAVPGEIVKPGQKLFTIRVLSEHLQTGQRELYQVIREQSITHKEKQRLEEVGGAIPRVKILELVYQKERLNAKEMSYRSEMLARGLSKDQIEEIIKGNFVKEISIVAPPIPKEKDKALQLVARREAQAPALFDVKKLKVHRGDQITAGQALCVISDHNVLYLEGRIFKDEVPLVREAMQNGWPVKMRPVLKEKKNWEEIRSPLKILFLGNEVDPESQTVSAYAPIVNQFELRTQEGARFRTWRFRPSQRVFLNIPVNRFKNAIVLPKEAVVQEGAEHYVFVQNGSAFDRKEIQVIYRDSENVVVANDGTLLEDISYVAHAGAAQLQRALQIQASSGNIDPHAGHMH